MFLNSLSKNIFSAPEEGQKLMKMKQKVSIFATQIELLKNQNNAIPAQTIAARDQLKHDLENILAAECTLCGSLMVQQLSSNFDIMDETW